jgi:hypothetical protein
MAIKPFYKKRALLLSALYCAAMFSLAAFAYVSLAWFTSKRTASVNFASAQVADGLSYKIHYFTKNHETGSYMGYHPNEVTSATVIDYATDFPEVNDTSSSGPLGQSNFAPAYASSFVFEITNANPVETVEVSLSQFTAPTSSSKYDNDHSRLISLSEATRIYTGFTSDSAAVSSYAKTFLSQSYADLTDSKFNHQDSGGVLSTPESWGVNTIPEGTTGYFFLTMYFSNDSATFYSPVSDEATTSDDGYVHYVHNTVDGNSNVYKGLSIVFNSLIINYA